MHPLIRLFLLLPSLLWASISLAETYHLPLFVHETITGQTGVLRLHNNSSAAGDVSIQAIDDAGTSSSAAPFTLTLPPHAALELSASQLGLGALPGYQRLQLDTDLPIQVLAYLRSGDGTRTVLHDQVRQLLRTDAQVAGDVFTYQVPFFNPSLNLTNASELRLVNSANTTASVRIEGRDDGGVAASGAVGLMLPAGHARTITASQLEFGAAELTGQLGTSSSAWRLTVTSDQPLAVINLVRSATGRIDNLSSSRVESFAPENQAAFSDLFLDKKITTNAGAASRTLTFLEAGAFEASTVNADMNATASAQSAAKTSGTYRYVNANASLGRLTLTYVDGQTCELQLYFASKAAGWYASICKTSEEMEGTWSGGSWTTTSAGEPPGPGLGPVQFSDTAAIPDQSYPLGVAITALSLPAATGGNGTLSYSLAMTAPGLVFDPDARQLTGTPTKTGTYTVTYSVVDGNATTDQLKFVITVREAVTGDCTPGMTLNPGDSCAYPGTSEMFSVSADGSARFLIVGSERLINIPTQTYRGHEYDFRASHQGEGVWRIERIQGQQAPTGSTPSFSNAAHPGDQTYTLDTATETLSLPEASGGDGTLVYSLSPSVPGLNFHADTRQLSGTPTEVGSYDVTYRVTDADGDSDTLAFTIKVGGIEGPDLIVESPTVDQATLAPQQSFTLTASLRNRGLDASDAVSLAYYLSTDAFISSDDLAVGTSSEPALSASASARVSTTLTAPSEVGVHYVGVCVAPVAGERNTDNNCSTGVRITITDPSGRPDLVVQPLTVSDSSVEASTSITVNATVRNQGGGQSASTTLRYYRSSNATITSRDTAIGTDSVATLAASGSSIESIRTSTPATAGVYYYGACIGAVANESDAENNCSQGVRVNVRDPDPDPVPDGPDLVVVSATVDDSSPEAGASFTLEVRVRNSGNQDAVATTVTFYQSSNSSIATSDTSLGTDAQSALAAGNTNTLSFSVTAPSALGTYYYGACVAAVSGERSTTNNCSRAARVRVEVDGPDLRVGPASASPRSMGAGDSFRLNATVRNHGNMESASTMLRYYQSADVEISSSDTEVATDSIGTLSASRSSSEFASLTAPSTPGTYYYGACVDGVSGETDTNNNCGTSVRVLVRGSDLVVISAGVDDGQVEAGDRITFSARVRNSGIAEAPATTLRYYRSDDDVISTSDTAVGTDSVGSTSPNQTRDESINQTAPSTPGTYYYGACVDTVTGEEDATNNCSSAVRLVVGAPDLVISSASVDDLTPDAGERFAFSVTVRNNGMGTAAGTDLRYLQSSDNEISSDDTEVAKETIGDISPRDSNSESERITAPSSPGTYYYYACVVAIDHESNTENNCSSVVRIIVPAPDLVVQSARVDDFTPDAGDSFRFSARVRNSGRGTAATTTLRYYRSTDNTISADDDTSVGTDGIGSLSGSDTDDENILLTAPDTPGTYFYGACVDTVAGESNTDNNCSSAVRVTVPAPDLIVTSPQVRDVTVEVGDDIDFGAIVHNRGGGEAAATTLRYYESSDSTIAADDREVGTDSVKSLSGSERSSESVDITAPSAGTYYYGACVTSVAGESNTDNNCSSGVRVVVSNP